MEDAKLVTQYEVEDEFHEALDDFPFYDCEETFFPGGMESCGDVSTSDDNKTMPPETLRRRGSHAHSKSSVADSIKSSKLSSSVSSENYLNSRERNSKLSSRIKERELKCGTEGVKDAVRGENTRNNEGSSSCTDANGRRGDEDLVRKESNLGENNGNQDANSSVLDLLARLVIKAISFQFDLSVKFFMFPIWLTYYLFMVVFNPFGVLKRVKRFLVRKMKIIWDLMRENVSPLVYEWFKEHHAIWKLGLKCGWGLLWSCYVCFVLVGLLVSSFVISGLLIRRLVEEPIGIKRNLNFDYTEKSPLAFVPIIAYPELSHETYLAEKPESVKGGGSRAIPANHKLQVTVLLTLPESDYNQNLGIFQVRVDFLAKNGRILASSRRPCMLQYKSQPIRLLLTFLKVAPILTGYTSESQNLKINIRGFTEDVVPTACLRVIIEPRAEFKPGAGIPEIYTSTLTLESELPFFRKVLWFWKKSLFVWTSMTIFTMELLFSLLCCKSVVIPRIRLREDSTNGDSPQIDNPVRG
ncbi:seipin-2-like [Primulina eburnea]|uniref:seipin-2-like n=1 Tax=Primulina eburnea TaxID=1245227 RepID=UPI003C6C037F